MVNEQNGPHRLNRRWFHFRSDILLTDPVVFQFWVFNRNLNRIRNKKKGLKSNSVAGIVTPLLGVAKESCLLLASCTKSEFIRCPIRALGLSGVRVLFRCQVPNRQRFEGQALLPLPPIMNAVKIGQELLRIYLGKKYRHEKKDRG